MEKQAVPHNFYKVDYHYSPIWFDFAKGFCLAVFKAIFHINMA
jgi:hypothetical protein